MKNGYIDTKPITTELRLSTVDKESFRAATYRFLKERIDAGAYDEAFETFYKSFTTEDDEREFVFHVRMDFGENDRSFMKCLIEAMKEGGE